MDMVSKATKPSIFPQIVHTLRLLGETFLFFFFLIIYFFFIFSVLLPMPRLGLLELTFAPKNKFHPIGD